MSDGGSGDPAAPVAGAGSAQEAAELPTEPGEPEAPASQGTVPAAAPDAAPPLREDQIANAVSFLSHDKARARTPSCCCRRLWRKTCLTMSCALRCAVAWWPPWSTPESIHVLYLSTALVSGLVKKPSEATLHTQRSPAICNPVTGYTSRLCPLEGLCHRLLTTAVVSSEA